MKYLLCAEEEVVLAPKDLIYLLEEDKIYIQVQQFKGELINMFNEDTNKVLEGP